ncbi:hypothetical protein HRG84_14110 [Flavisolibacter sp. BT320]|nr:hypothetical protein [Flavisolibacter longurius]
MISLFRQKTPGNVIVLLIFGFLLKAPLFLYPKPVVVSENDEDLYHALANLLLTAGTNAPLWASAVAFMLLYAQALMVNYLMNAFRMMSKATYLPGMAYLLVTSLLPEWSFLSSPLVASTLIILTFIILFRLYNLQDGSGRIYNMGLLLGISSYIYFPSAAFMLCLLLGMMILKPFKLNEIVLFFLGCLTPYYFYGAYLFLTDNLSFDSFVPHVSVKVPEVKSTVWLAISTLFLTLPFLVGGFFVQGQLHKMLIQVRKNWSIMLLYLILAFFVPFINTYTSFSNWVLVAVPFACFHAATYFYTGNKWVANGLFVLTVGYILYLQYGTVLWQ